jgi:hypothetical protein
MTDAVTEGRKAWDRIRGRERTTWNDWLAVGNALIIGRAAALRASKANRPVGARYNLAMGEWLRDNGLADISAQERYRVIMIVDNIDAISKWRDGLDDAVRRQFNHPNAVWHAWRRATAPSPQHRAITRHVREREGKPVYWLQDAMKRAHRAMLDSRSSNLLILACVALEATIRTEDDLLALLETPKARAPACTHWKAPPLHGAHPVQTSSTQHRAL